MLFKLSLKNIKKSFKDYAIYFFTLILGVAIFYVFNAIDSQTVLLDVTRDTRELIKLMTNMLSGVSVFVSLILGFLIIYASRFLMKRRNKEFGIYLTLGMSKRKISMILFLDDLVSTPEGVCIGMSKEDMEKAYGTDYEVSSGFYRYTKDNMKLSFIIENEEITSIEYDSMVLNQGR